ncbi:hypothetical protein JOM56_015407 [Amanita muscaria]
MLAWGGEKEQAKEQEAGNSDAKNWQDEALRIFEKTVPRLKRRNTTGRDDSILSDFDRHRQSLLKQGNNNETWGAEIRRYLNDVEDVAKDTDVVKWWQASSVPCERLFSSSKQVAVERRSRLGSDHFEQLLMMKSAWQDTMVDWAAVNSDTVEEVELNEYSDLLQADVDADKWEKEDEQFIIYSD